MKKPLKTYLSYCPESGLIGINYYNLKGQVTYRILNRKYGSEPITIDDIGYTLEDYVAYEKKEGYKIVTNAEQIRKYEAIALMEELIS